jgi:signal transduction histidine kinase
MRASLKGRLIWILLSLILLVWLASATIALLSTGRALQNQIDTQLGQYTHLVTYISRIFARQIDEGLPLYDSWGEHDLQQLRTSPMVVEGPEQMGLNPAVNIWLADKLIAVIEGSPHFERPTTEGFSYLETSDGSGRWRVLTQYDDVSELWIRVGVEFDAARQSMLATLGRELLPLLIVIPLTIAVLYLGVSRGLIPLNNLAQQIYRRKPGLLDPIEMDNVPIEISGLVTSINELMHHQAYALEAEQRFTANAAHELMTPLAAIKTEVQLCQRLLRDEQGTAMLQRISQRVDRASHSVEQLLILARLDPDARVAPSPVQLRSLLIEVLADTAHLAADRQLEIALEDGEACQVLGNKEALAILLRNLLNNAFRYASDHSIVHIRLSATNPAAGAPVAAAPVELEICNDCAALPAAEFSQLLDRFYRVPGSVGMGAGLGLSIVSRITDLHHANFSVSPRADGTGFCASLTFNTV